MRISGDGNVGIGTTDPQAKLHVNGIIKGDGSQLTNVTPGGSAGGDLAGTYPNPTIGTNAVTSAKLLDGAVRTSKIANGAITTFKILDGAIDSSKLAADAVQTADIANDAVTAAKLNDSAVTTSKIANAAITTFKILDGAIDSSKLATDAVQTADIAKNAVTAAKLANDAASLSKVSGGNVTVSGANVGIGVPNPSAKLEVNGSITITNTHNPAAPNRLETPVLAITGGADIAELFDSMGGNIPEGSVMVIDEANPGHLKLSDRAYDTRVAGIVSGAGGVNPGLTLSQQGVMEGRHNVALAGRVYARADATAHPIRPGDLLTTSPTPGHLMPATDRDRAQGAILGKAMTSLESGTGLVLVLVTLQ